MPSIETRRSWVVTWTALALLSVTYGAPQIVVVALKPIASSLGNERELPALAYSLAWVGAAVGGLGMGRVAERIGVRYTVAFGAVMVELGLALSSGGERWQFVAGHGVFIGLLGNAGLNAPLYVYISRWFDRRRGAALALISSGQYIAGVIWPMVFQRSIDAVGWPHTMQLFGVLEAVIVVPVALLVLRDPPEPVVLDAHLIQRKGGRVLGLRPNLALLLLSIAGFCCCVPMAMPQGHLVAFCSDVGIAPSHGAAMLSLLLACAFVSRQFWGWLSDRVGGLNTIFAGSLFQLLSMTGFLLTQNESGLFVVSALFGLGFSGLIPAYVLAVRELFPAIEASWRVPTMLLFSGSGMAAGGWLAGWIFDHAGFYGAAFAAGLGFNLVNLLIIGALVLQSRQTGRTVLVGAE
ncbi:MAG: MFS transporter [Acetobacteraceae bacterium]|nr:MFS transporter [Acetobacteraceae bacterium]